MGSLIFKGSVKFDKPTVGGACLLAALAWTAHQSPFDLMVTCGTEAHEPDDPHTKGNALDVRSHSFSLADKNSVFHLIMSYLSDLTDQLGADARVISTSDGLATALFFGFIESEGMPNEHFHLQVRKGQHVPTFEPPTTRAA